MGRTFPPCSDPDLSRCLSTQIRIWDIYPSSSAGETKEIQNRVGKSRSKKRFSPSVSLLLLSLLLFTLLAVYYLQ